ncbi:MAG: N-acetylmuramoyl-L-alanine amidase [Eubacteriales bacterium]|nr:N-acetylmuramoyl-L-alanine amidase [Eubacteriales bacterium]
MKKFYNKKTFFILIVCTCCLISSCNNKQNNVISNINIQESSDFPLENIDISYNDNKKDIKYYEDYLGIKSTVIKYKQNIYIKDIPLDLAWENANKSKIHSHKAKLYINSDNKYYDKIIAINAGHGTKDGEKQKTLSHPDGSPKVTGGTNAVGEVNSMAISSGMTFLDGTTEAEVNLKFSLFLRDELLNLGYSVLMLRENDNTQLDNIARTVISNNVANIHISIHYNSTTNDEGIFYIGAPKVKSFLEMEPVINTYKMSDELGDCIINYLKNNNEKIYGNGRMGMDLTQISYSNIPTIDLELGDKASDHSDLRLNELSKKIALAINDYFVGE